MFDKISPEYSRVDFTKMCEKYISLIGASNTSANKDK